MHLLSPFKKYPLGYSVLVSVIFTIVIIDTWFSYGERLITYPSLILVSLGLFLGLFAYVMGVQLWHR